MAILDTGKAIRRVSELLKDQLQERLKIIQIPEPGQELKVNIGRPQLPTNGNRSNYERALNIFLYEASFDATLRNASLAYGEPAPLWLVLKYIITAFDDNGETDTAQAHGYLGEGVRTLQELAYLPLTLDPSDPTQQPPDALMDNPQELKITFDEIPSELISKLMQGPDDKYRFSMGFQIRPVMIRTRELPSQSLLVGVNYSLDPAAAIAEEPYGVELDIVPSMGPSISEVNPFKVEPGDELEIKGSGLDQAGLAVRFGSVELGATSQRPDSLTCIVDSTIPDGEIISAGSHPVAVIKTLPNGRRRTSNLLIANLLPVLTTAVPGGITNSDPTDSDSDIEGHVDLTGILLGTDSDDVMMALYQDGTIIRDLDSVVDLSPPPATAQTGRRLLITADDEIPPGRYRLIVRVNGQQAKNSPLVELIP